MRIILLFFIAVISFAFEVKIKKVVGDKIFLNSYVQKGLSGIVVCPYMKEEIICARVISNGKEANLYAYAKLKNNAFGLPLVYPKPGDKVIFGKNYNRIVIIAPNQTTYLKLKNRYKGNSIISPDVLVAFLGDEVDKKELINFAKDMDIGRYIFALKDGLYEVDALSFYVLNKIKFKGSDFKNAFFTYARNIDIKPVNYKKFFKGLK
jgi:hypothetical protein